MSLKLLQHPTKVCCQETSIVKETSDGLGIIRESMSGMVTHNAQLYESLLEKFFSLIRRSSSTQVWLFT